MGHNRGKGIHIGVLLGVLGDCHQYTHCFINDRPAHIRKVLVKILRWALNGKHVCAGLVSAWPL